MIGRDRKGRRVIIWPSYIDSSLTRSRGRRLSLKDCVWKPKIEEVVKAAQLLDLNPVVLNKCYPRNWLDDRQAVEVDKVSSKRAILKMIASKIKDIRSKK